MGNKVVIIIIVLLCKTARTGTDTLAQPSCIYLIYGFPALLGLL